MEEEGPEEVTISRIFAGNSKTKVFDTRRLGDFQTHWELVRTSAIEGS